MNRFQQELEKRKEESLLRQLPTRIDSIDFYSNDYLGLARSKTFYKEVEREYYSIEPKRIGSTGSRLLSGNSKYVEETESFISRFHGSEAALLFSNGYAANLGLLSAVGNRSTTFFFDELIHASLIDGIRLTKGKRTKFRHNDLADLEEKLKSCVGEKIIVAESIYSMDGDICPILEILELCDKFGAYLIVDEAHAIGVIGENGEGYCSSLGVSEKVLATIVTYGKAMGTHGAAILGKKWLIDYLINFARSFIYSTAPSNHQVASVRIAYNQMMFVQDMRSQLDTNVDYFIRERQQLELIWTDSQTAIQSLIIPGNVAVSKAAEKLNTAGYSILPIRSPTVKEGEERLRISLHAFNTLDEIDGLFKTLKNGF